MRKIKEEWNIMIIALIHIVKGVGAQDSRSPTPEFVGRLGTGAGILPWTPYGERGEIKSSKGRLGDNLFLD